jgi:hypothetical protein
MIGQFFHLSNDPRQQRHLPFFAEFSVIAHISGGYIYAAAARVHHRIVQGCPWACSHGEQVLLLPSRRY